MIKLLNNNNIDEILELLRKYHKKEDENFEIILNRDRKDLEILIKHGYIYGKYKKNKLIGFASMSKYNAIKGLKKTNAKNKIRKKQFLVSADINNENTALFLNDLIDINYRGKGFYKDLTLIRLEKVKELGYKNIVVYLNINKVVGINNYIKNGWKFGTLIEILENRYELLLYYTLP
jgi:hypothetical protein